MSSEGEGTASYTAEIAAIATREREQIDARLMLLLGEIEEVRAEKRKLDSVLKALNGSVAKTAPKNGSGKKPLKISDKKREQAMNFIRGNREDITSQKLREALNTSGSDAANILAVFRAEGLIRLSATQGNMNIFRSLV